ncbi:MAG: hypothetical protein ACRD18_04860 [Terriglobia bacterium]
MFSISCAFDKESGVDAMDPFGDIRLTDGRSTILIPSTYLDSWLKALVKALDQVRNGTSFAVAIPEEPKPLQIDVGIDGIITVRHGGETVVAEDSHAFEGALRVVCKTFIGRLSHLSEAFSNPAITAIRRFYQANAQP